MRTTSSAGTSARGPRVVIAIDPHKASWTVAVVDSALVAVAGLRVPVSHSGYQRLRRFATGWPTASWAIEGADGLGAPLARWLAADGITATDVPAKLAARVRMLSTGHGRKTDHTDATSVGIAALSATGLRNATVTDSIIALRALVEHRDDIVATRTRTVNRLHILLTQLLPGGAPRALEADTAARLLRGVRRPSAEGPRTLRQLAVELIAEIRHLDRRITATTSQIRTALATSATSLTQLHGIGELTAAKILARVGEITRFRSAAAFASYTGTAPIEVSSGEVVRHRLSRAGDRQLNYCLHVMALSQIRHHGPGRNYYQHKRATGKSHKEALRCLKRRLSDLVYRQLVRDTHPEKATGPAGQPGATLTSSAAGPTPRTDTSEKSQTGPVTNHPTTPKPRST